MTFYNHLHTHTQSKSFLFILHVVYLFTVTPAPWCDLSETQHSRVLSQCEEEEPFFRKTWPPNQCADEAIIHCIFMFTGIFFFRITVCS